MRGVVRMLYIHYYVYRRITYCTIMLNNRTIHKTEGYINKIIMYVILWCVLVTVQCYCFRHSHDSSEY